MKRLLAFLVVAASLAAGPAYALYSVSNIGEWPDSWPKELDALRAQSLTLVGPEAPCRHYAIPFTKREQMESAWPHLLKTKAKGAPIFLVRGPNFFLGEKARAGVIVHAPPLGQVDEPPADANIKASDMRERWHFATHIELVVDGDIVDLNRLKLPADTPIIDERFKEKK